MPRATQAVIDLHALRHNYQLVKQRASLSRAYAVVKANAYGHGAQAVANALSGVADGFAVATVEEAQALRQGGILLPIMVLEGPMDLEDCRTALELDLELVLHQMQQVHWLGQLTGAALAVWIKVDSGMHRLGFAIQEVPNVASQLRQIACVKELRLMSHFACADEPEHELNMQQYLRMQTLLPMKLELSLSNSAAILSQPQCHYHLVRPGIMLYGASPFTNKPAHELGLQSVMNLHSQVIAVHHLAAGEAVGYGQDWHCQRTSRIAVVAIGYGDGYPRCASPAAQVMIRGKAWPLVGRVSMDMVTVDVTGDSLAAEHNVQLGDRVTLWGAGLGADEVARQCGTIAYELFCQLTPRVRREYLGR